LVVLNTYYDLVIDSVLNYVSVEEAAKPLRRYVGASSIGHKCERFLWFLLHIPEKASPTPATLTLAANDGHRSEALMAEYLRNVEGVPLRTEKEDGTQSGLSEFDGKFKFFISIMLTTLFG